MNLCYKCGHDFNLQVKPTRSDTCEKCGSFIRCCFNCKFYDDSAANSCREPSAVWVADRAIGNFCGYFEILQSDKRRETAEEIKNKVQNDLKNLFKI